MEHSSQKRLSDFIRRGQQYNNKNDDDEGSPSPSSTRFHCESFHETRDESEFVSFGNTLLKEEKFNEAALCYTEAIKKNDSAASYYRRRGYCRLRVRKSDKALLDFRKAEQLDPNNSLGQTFLNEALFDAEKFDELIQRIHTLHYGRTLLASLADQLYEAEKFEHALRFYTELIIQDPKNSTYRHRRAHCYWEKGDLAEAIFDFQKAVNLDQSNVEHGLDLGEALLENKKFHEAEVAVKNIDEHSLRKSDFARLEMIRQKIKDASEQVEEKTQTDEQSIVTTRRCESIRKRIPEKNSDELQSRANV